jgi:hypothetical protein
MKTLEQRFLSKVIIPGDRNACWEWLGGTTKHGYAQLSGVRLNRLAYMMFNGNLIEGLVVMHTCDNRICVNPNHLIQGTQKQNMQDCSLKKRNHQQKKTHCPQGHEYNEQNTYFKYNKRVCRACAMDYMRRKRKRCNTPT